MAKNDFRSSLESFCQIYKEASDVDFESLAKQVAEKYVKYGDDLNYSIAEIAKQKELNENEINTLLQRANTETYVKLYSSKKKEANSRVIFPIAKLDAVKDLMVDTSQKQMDKSDEEAEKTASQTLPLSFNDTGYVPSLWDEHKIETNKRKHVVKKLDSLVDESMAKVGKLRFDLEQTCDKLASCLIKYAKKGFDVSDLFNNLCVDATLDFKSRKSLKDRFEKKAEHVKNSYKFFSGLEIKSDDSYLSKLASKKGSLKTLGKHSLLKEAESVDVETVPTLPNIVIDDETIDGYMEMVEIARELKDTQNNKVEEDKVLDSLKDKLDKISK